MEARARLVLSMDNRGHARPINPWKGGVIMISPRYILFAFALMVSLGASMVEARDPALSDRTLIVGTKEAPPFAMKSADGTWTGISIDLWRQIATDLNLKYELRETDLKGLLDGVASGSLDVAVAALTITPEREEAFDFTHPFHATGLGIAMAWKAGNPWVAVLKRVFSPTFLKVVVTLSVLLLAVGMLVWWFERKTNPQQFGGGPAKGIGSAFWWSAVTMTTVGYGDKAPVSLAGRVVALIWMFGGIIMISGFTAAIASSLTVAQLESPVKGPGDLSKVRVGTITNSTAASYLRDKRIGYQTYQTAPEGLQAVAEGKIQALVYDAPLLRYLINQGFKGSLQVLPNTFLRQDYGIALPPRSALRETVNRVLLQKISEPAWQDTVYKYLGE
ncbi:MAG TPA: transporter substrate-binding domain-containing protein [Desulfobacterales bacterium]|nr:transporter substrate-binding domain-containing protein [Desulfobacterales bacterium]